MLPKKRRHTSLFGLSTPEVYPAGTVTHPLVRSYRTFSPLPTATEGLSAGVILFTQLLFRSVTVWRLFSVALAVLGCLAARQSFPLGSRVLCVARTFLVGRLTLDAAVRRPITDGKGTFNLRLCLQEPLPRQLKGTVKALF